MPGRISLECGGALGDELREVLREVFGINPGEYIRGPLRSTRVNNDICVIYEPIKGARLRPTMLFSGRWVGLSVKGLVVPSIQLLNEIYSREGPAAAIIVAEQGVKAFLYGNDVLVESVIEAYPPADGIVGVLDSTDMKVIGVAKYSKKEGVYKNVYDAGIFLRLLG